MAAQQDTGAVMISSRGNWGQINFTDWSPVPSSEFGVVTPDPKNPHIIYGVGYGPGGGGSGLIKIDMSTGQWENVAPNFGADATKYHSRPRLPEEVRHRLRSQRSLRCLPVPAGVARRRPFLDAVSPT